jgi:hypothetical protein
VSGIRSKNECGGPKAADIPVVETGVDPVTPRFSGVCSAN